MSADDPSDTEAHDQRLGEAIEAYLESLHRGEVVKEEQWLHRYPDLAEDLRECLAALRMVQQLTPSDSATDEADRSARGATDQPEVGVPASAPPPAPLPRVPGYSVIEEIGRGGMGVVYRALQLKTKRLVALKVLAGGLHPSARERRRFEREVELAAGLDHPGIVRVLESGETESGAYCAMELVEGESLQVYLARRRTDVSEKLRLFVEIADAVHYAHQRAVLHRDLKPTNVMVDAVGHPRILDFGLACLVREGVAGADDERRITRTGQLLGTLPYLSPEQARGSLHDVDVRSDLYALGVLLFEMLTGSHPYDTSGDLAGTLHHICHSLPPRPSQYCRDVRPDLDAIVLKALEKPRERRYQTAAEMAADVRCYLRGEPVEANRSVRFYLLRKAYARHRRQVQLAAITLILVLLTSVAILTLYLQVREESRRLQEQLHVSHLRHGTAHLAAGHDLLAESLLWKAYRELPDRRAHWSLLGYYTQNPLAAAAPGVGWVTCTAFSPDGRYLAHGNLAGLLGIRAAQGLQPIVSIPAHDGGVSCVDFSPDGAWLATGGADGRLRLWKTATWEPAADVMAHPGGLTRLRFDRAGSRLLSAGRDGRILLWKPSRTNPPAVVFTYETHSPNPVADWSPDGRTLAVAEPGRGVRIIEAVSGRALGMLAGFKGPVEAVRFSPDEKRIAVWSHEEVSLWNLAEGARAWADDAGLSEPRPTSLWDFPADAEDAPDQTHMCWTPSLAFSDDAALIASAGWGAIVRFWSVEQGRRLGDLRAHGTAVYSVSFAPQSRRLAAGSIETLRVWDLAHHPGVLSWPLPARQEHTCVAITPDATRMAWGGARDGTVCLINLSAPDRASRWEAHAGAVEALAFDHAGRRLATSDRDGNLTLWSLADRRLLKAWSTGRRFLRALAFSSDDSLIASGSRHGRLDVRRCEDGALVQAWQAHAGLVLAVACAPDSDLLATGGTDWTAKFWRIGRAEPIGRWRHGEWVNAVAFSPDGERVATGGADLMLRIGRPAASPDVWPQQAHAHWINALAFLDGGAVLVSGGNDAALRFWDTSDGSDLATLPSPGGPVHTLAASEDGRWLAVGTARLVQLFDLGGAADRIHRQAASQGD